MYLTEIHRNEDKNNSAQYEAKIALDFNLMFPVSLSEYEDHFSRILSELNPPLTLHQIFSFLEGWYGILT